MSSSNCCFLTCIQVSQEAGQVSWYSHLLQNFPQFVVIHTVKGFGIVNKVEIDGFFVCLFVCLFLELSCFFNHPTDIGYLIFGSSAFSKSSLYVWMFSVHIPVKPSLENFEHASMWNEHNCMVLNILWHCPSLGLEWKLTFSIPVATVVFQICWHIECSTFTASFFRIWNNSAGIPSLPLALFVVMLPQASHSRMSGSRMITPSWLSGSLRSFLYSSVYSCHLLLIFYASVNSMPFISFFVSIFAWNDPLVSLIFLKRWDINKSKETKTRMDEGLMCYWKQIELGSQNTKRPESRFRNCGLNSVCHLG